MATTRQKNRNVLILIAAIALLGGGMFSYNIKQKNEAAQVPIQERVEAAVYYEPREISEAVLIDYNEAPFSRDDLKGKWSFVFFGFTHCPDICPMTLVIADELMAQLDQHDVRGAAPNQFILMSLDPDRDTPARLREYVTYFNPDFLAVTGSEENLDDWTNSMGVLYMTVFTDDAAGYTIDHSGSILLINPDGKLHAQFSMPHIPDQIAQDFVQIRQAYQPA